MHATESSLPFGKLYSHGHAPNTARCTITNGGHLRFSTSMLNKMGHSIPPSSGVQFC